MHSKIKPTVKTSLNRSFEQLRALNRSEIGQCWLKSAIFSVWVIKSSEHIFGMDSVCKINLTSWLDNFTVDMISIWYQVCLYSTTRWRKMSIWNFYSEIWPYNISDHQFSSRLFQPFLVLKIINLELKTKIVCEYKKTCLHFYVFVF